MIAALGKDRRWFQTGVRLCLCAGVLVVLVSHVSWYDYLELTDGSSRRVVSREGDLLTLQLNPGGPLIQIALTPDSHIRPGIKTIWRDTAFHALAVGGALQIILQGLLISRWWLLLRHSGALPRLWHVTVWHGRAQALGPILLGQLGADTVRIQQSISGAVPPAGSVGVIIAERSLGLAALTLLALCGLHSLPGYAASARLALVALVPVAVLAGALIVLAVLRWYSLYGMVPAWLRSWLRRASSFCLELACHFQKLSQHPLDLVLAALLTVTIHLLVIAVYLSVDHSLHLHHPWSVYFVVIPLVSLISCLPFIGGLLAMDASCVVLLTQIGALSATEAMAVCMVVRLLDLVCRIGQALLFCVPMTLPRKRPELAE